METKINIAELLKDCPSGMELDCTIFDDVYFDYIDDVSDIINCYIQDSTKKIGISFSKYGCYSSISKSKCVIFPKGKTTWVGFVPPIQFKDGDIITCTNTACSFVAIFKWRNTDKTFMRYVSLTLAAEPQFSAKERWADFCKPRLATEEEKQKLFKAIKDNGYHWNAETKTLEKLIKPIFKVGDKIRYKRGNRVKRRIVKINNREEFYYTDDGGRVYFMHQDDWELVPNKFDITTLKPFDKVLCRDSFEDTWTTGFYSHFETTELSSYYVVNGTGSDQCIPYNGDTKHLIGTTNDCDEYYKTWK